MIPDFKTYIGESVWGDIRRRGLGKETKVEDDINILDGYGLFEYLKKHYDYGSLHNIQHFDDLDQICVCLYEDEAGYYTYLFYSGISDDPELEISSGVHHLPDDLSNLLDKRYTITSDEREDAELYTKIEPKGCRYDKLTNWFFLDVLDFILDNLKNPFVKKKNVSESVWGDIRKRGLGSEVKAEDDVNHMDFDTFADYIKDNYSEKGDWFSVVESDNERSRHIEIDIISGIDLSFNVVDGEIYNILIQNNANKYIDVPGLKKIFNVNILGSSTFGVVEKDWTKSNNTFVKLIEFFLDKKTTNESVWGDIRKQGLGKEVKAEDDVDNLDMEGFYDYLNDHYETSENTVIRKYDDLHALLVPIVSSELNFQRTSLHFIEINFDPDDVTETKIIMSLRSLSEIPYIDESLRKVFCVVDRDKNAERGKHIEIYPKDGGESTIVTNTFFLEVLDFILKEAEGKYTILLKKK